MKKHAMYSLSFLVLCFFSATAQKDYNYLNGSLLRESESSSTPNIYLIHMGKKCLIPNPETQRILFDPDAKIQYNLAVSLIPDGQPITDRAVIVQGSIPQFPESGSKIPNWSSDILYLITNGKKLRIVNPEAYQKYHFRKNARFNVPQSILDAIPSGEDIN